MNNGRSNMTIANKALLTSAALALAVLAGGTLAPRGREASVTPDGVMQLVDCTTSIFGDTSTLYAYVYTWNGNPLPPKPTDQLFDIETVPGLNGLYHVANVQEIITGPNCK
jgi:hypothetical protein